jgi:hypothetical protein
MLPAMGLTVRDPQMAADNGRQFQAVAEAMRTAANNGRQLQAMAEAIRGTAIEACRHQVQDIASREATVPASVPAAPDIVRPPVVRLLLHTGITALMAALVIAYWEAKKDNDPEEALLNPLFATWLWYEVHSELWSGPK